ncbi:putative phospholipase d delta [Corchorus olitorius]|uniref:Phospholipase d delta n=1 Tax=Corchorus olitorius TaxID=93759 RepID=A0A1R3HV15_9ROSI|nr:putative phospholipase d delta [Corchorus olitorius]
MALSKLQAMAFLFLSIFLFAQLNDAVIGAQSTSNCEIVTGTTCFVFQDCREPCVSIGRSRQSALCIPNPNSGVGGSLTCCCSTL